MPVNQTSLSKLMKAYKVSFTLAPMFIEAETEDEAKREIYQRFTMSTLKITLKEVNVSKWKKKEGK